MDKNLHPIFQQILKPFTMQNELGDQPAFPLIEEDENKVQRSVSQGLTKREYFAGLAMQGLLAGTAEISVNTALEIPDNTAKWAVAFADALIASLNKAKP